MNCVLKLVQIYKSMDAWVDAAGVEMFACMRASIRTAALCLIIQAQKISAALK